jgi:hypothetical protein
MELEPAINGHLVSCSALALIANIAKSLPAYVSDVFGFETRLIGDNMQTDFSINLSKQGCEYFKADNIKLAPGLYQIYQEKWSRLGQFINEWGLSNSTPFADANSVWLEFDIHKDQMTPLMPSMILFAYWLSSSPSKMIVKRPIEWLTNTILPILTSDSLSDQLVSNLKHYINLSHPATYFQVGAMFTRNIDAIRLCIFTHNAEETLALIDSLGIDWAYSGVKSAIKSFEADIDSFCVNIDIGSKIYPRIGLELLYNETNAWRRQPKREPRWYSLLDHLVEQGLCEPQRREALLSWPGYSSLRSAGKSGGLLLRGLQHIKLVFSPDHQPESKAYFGASPHFFTT